MNMFRSMRRKKVRTMMEKQHEKKLNGKKLKVWWDAYLKEEAKAAHRRKLAKEQQNG